MYTILLTDDEQIMIDSLTFIISKNFGDDVKIFSALSGSQALEIAAKNQIDIIFMDINMPGLNGLQTVSYIKQSKPDTIVVILSALDQFQYAQEAVNIGAFKYLTKPVNRNTVIETVKSAFAEISRKRGRLSDEVELHKKLEIVSPMVESDFIYSAAFSSGKDISEYFSYFGIENCIYCFCCLEIPHLDDKNKFAIYTKIREILSAKSHCIIGSFMANRLALFFYFPDRSGKSGYEEEMRAHIREIFALLSLNVSATIRAGVSAFEKSSAETAIAYGKALEALTSAQSGVVFASTIEKDESESAGKAAEKIFGRIKSGDPTALPPLLDSYTRALEKKQSGDTDKIKNSLFALLVNARNIASEISAQYHNTMFDNAFSVFSKENDRETLRLFVINLLVDCASAVREVSEKADNPIICRAVEFVKEHLSENISLDETAQAVNVSPFYLSKLFKEEKNETYIAFVTNTRLEKARDLLQNPRSSIKEVSAAVGYNDQNYFSRLFRNQFGMTPTEFRDARKK